MRTTFEAVVYASAVMQRGRRIRAAAECMRQREMGGWLHCQREIELINDAITALVPSYVCAGKEVRA